MDLQMQLRRALIALALFAALGGIALSRAGSTAAAALHATDPQAAPATLSVGMVCPARVRLEFGALSIGVACDRHCRLLHDAAQAVGVVAALQPAACSLLRTA